MQQLQDGIHEIPNSVYHGSLGISRSALMEFKKSPYHYWYKYINQERTPSYTTTAMKLGELVHCLVLEPQCFDERYAMRPSLKELPKVGLLKDVGREEYDQQKADRELTQTENNLLIDEFASHSEGKEIITTDMYTEAKLYADSVLNNSVAQALFTGVYVEKSIYFTHKETGLQCKVRPDAWMGGVVTDLKTCKDASFDAFQRAAVGSGYFTQAAMIKYALATIGIEMQKFIFYCVEKTEAAPCTYYELDAETLERAENEYNTLMHGIAYCMETNRWGAYQPQTLTYPAWAKI
jgi:hypothetical protein